jgi:hypothetical protein
MVSYQTLDPHPKVISKWKELHYLPDSTRIPVSESRAFQLMGAGKVIALVEPFPEDPKMPRTEKICVKTEEDPQRPIKRTITHVYRIKTPEGKEFFFYKHHLEGENFQGDKKVDVTQIVGRYYEPDFEKVRNRETGTTTITGHKDGRLVYEIPFAQNSEFVDPATGERTTLEELRKFVRDKIWTYVYTSGRKYELIGINFDQFISKSYEDLVYYGMHNRWPEPKPMDIETKPSRKKLDSE